MKILFFVLAVICGLMFIAAHKRVRGLRGGYNQGVWAESSSFLVEARAERVQFGFLFVVAIVCFYFLL